MKAAFAVLLEALEYAQNLGTSVWDFAVDVGTLRRLKLSNGDLRWALVRGLVEHAVEITPDHDSARSFRHGERTLFGSRSCFVLTTSGAALAHELCGQDHGPEPEAVVRLDQLAADAPAADQRLPPPNWDRNRRELRVGAVVVKRFTIPATSQESILAAFEEQNWPQRIDDPLPGCDEVARTARLREIVDLLNRGQKQPLVQFVGDGGGLGIAWQHTDSPSGRCHD
jgi:hypothetical protein